MIDKPAYGAPCNRCGHCCKAGPCGPGLRLFGGPADQPCPALETEPSGATNCGLMVDPAKYAPIKAAIYGVDVLRASIRLLLVSGFCDSQTENEPNDASVQARIDTGVASIPIHKRLAAMRIWL